MDKIPNKYWTVCICVVLALVTFALFWQLHSYDFIYYDDPANITENQYVPKGLTIESIKWAFTTKYGSNWHPLTWLSHMADCQLFGINPGRHHLTNLLFHIVNTLLLFLVFQSMTGALWPSAFVAALFALHPLHVESVAWISGRKDVLSTLFWLLILAAYVRYTRHPVLSWYLLMILTFALGLMAKPMLVTLPFVLLLLDYWPLNRFQKKRTLRLIQEKIPLFLCSIISCLITLFVEAKEAGASLDKLSIKARFANTPVAYMTYITKTFWPSKLAVFYPHPRDNFSVWQVALATLLLLGISICTIRLAQSRRYLVVGWLWFLGTLVPVIGLVQVGLQAMADRYTYVPLIGLFIIIAWGTSELSRKWRYQKVALSISASIVLLILSVCTWIQVRYWQSSEALFTHTLNVTSKNSIINYNMGTMLVEQGRFGEAMTYFHQALQADPENPTFLNNLAIALLMQGRLDEAADYFYKALKLGSDDTNIHYNLGNILQVQGKFDEAVSHYYQALRLDPNDAGTHNNLGSALLAQGKFDEAISYFRQALQIDPNYTEARDNLNIALKLQGKPNN